MADELEQEEPIDSAKTPTEWQRHWTVELEHARRTARKWKKHGEKITDIYLDDREKETDSSRQRGYRLNLFSSNVNTLQSMLLGQIPTVDVSRRHADANDDVSRVASEMLARVLNLQQRAFGEHLAVALNDRLIAGVGTMRVRYEVEMGDAPPAGPQPAAPFNVFPLAPVKASEKAIAEYVNWRDVVWSPARTWDEVTWIGIRSYLDKAALTQRFGPVIAGSVPLTAKTGGRGGTDDGLALPGGRDAGNATYAAANQKAEVWEIWHLSDKTVYWVAPGAETILDAKDDPLQLDGFWPLPRPMLANVTSGQYAPRADYLLAQDQYRQIDILTTRITLITQALRLAGVYDRLATGVQRLVSEKADNELIPVDSWAAFAERGGLKGAIDWMPIEQAAAVLNTLVAQRAQIIELLYQATGMSDILRGATQQNETATAQSIKSRFASTRVQNLQDDFARFASDAQRLVAQIIVRFYDDETIVRQSGLERTPDAPLIPAELQLLRDPEVQWRIEIESSALAAQDMALIRAEKTEFIQGLAMFLGAATPMVEKYPATAPALLEMLQWTMAGYRGSRSIEGVLDRAIASLQQQPQQPSKPDPAVIKQKGDMERIGAEAQVKQREIQMQTAAKLMEIEAKSRADVRGQAAQAIFDTRAAQKIPKEEWQP